MFFFLHVYRYVDFDIPFYFIFSRSHTHKYILKNAKEDFLKILLKLDFDLITVFQIMSKDVSFKLSC